jgi:hypothetical protein
MTKKCNEMKDIRALLESLKTTLADWQKTGCGPCSECPARAKNGDCTLAQAKHQLSKAKHKVRLPYHHNVVDALDRLKDHDCVGIGCIKCGYAIITPKSDTVPSVRCGVDKMRDLLKSMEAIKNPLDV